MTAWPRPNVVDALPPAVDVVVIGGGIVGAATAFFAQRAGLRVLLLEKRAALCTLTTPVSTGAFRLQFDNPEEIALVRESIALFDDFADVAGLPGYDLAIRQQGYLFCATTDAGVAHQRHFVNALHGWGVADVELLTGDEARYRFPFLSPEIVQARFRAGDGWLDPKRLTLGYARASRRRDLPGDAGDWLRPAPAIGVTGVITPRGTVSCAPRGRRLRAVRWAGRGAGRAAARPAADDSPQAGHSRPPAIPPDGPMTIHEETAAHWRPGLRGAMRCGPSRSTPAGEPLDDVPDERRRSRSGCSIRARRAAWRG